MPARAALIYDDECARCRASAFWIMRRALRGGALEILPGRSSVRRERFPQLPEGAWRPAMHLALPDGRVLVGAEVVPELWRRIRGWGWLVRVLALPGLRRVALPLYGWLARRRVRIVCDTTA